MRCILRGSPRTRSLDDEAFAFDPNRSGPSLIQTVQEMGAQRARFVRMRARFDCGSLPRFTAPFEILCSRSTVPLPTRGSPMSTDVHALPSLIDTLSEPWRAGFDAARLALRFDRLVKQASRGEGHTVLALPSYGTGDGGTRPLRTFLTRLGYDAPESALGRNIDRGELRIRGMEDAARFRKVQGDRVLERLESLAVRGKQVSLVGWSMGGLFALDVSQRAPDLVRSVVTMGTPFGDPRGTSMFNLMRSLSRSSEPVEEQDFGSWTAGCTLATQSVPITVIHSDRDGIVGRSAARLPDSPCVRHVEVDSSHLGFAAHPEVFAVVADSLTRSRPPSGSWPH